MNNNVISARVSKNFYKKFKKYIKENNLSVAIFVKNAVIEKFNDITKNNKELNLESINKEALNEVISIVSELDDQEIKLLMQLIQAIKNKQ